MKVSIVVVLVFAAVMSSAAISSDLSVRDALKATLPTAWDVVVELEAAQGHHFSDEELRVLVKSREFERAVVERALKSQRFLPCRIDRCVLA